MKGNLIAVKPRMVESSSDLPRIPENIRSAFREAVGLFCNWWGPAPEPLVSVDQRHFTISAVCGFVMKFDDVMPEYLRYLLELINAHKAKYHQSLCESAEKSR
jgi:hypothetical protein